TAAECALPVASNWSSIAMISLSVFFMRPSGGYLLVVVEGLEQTPEGRAIRDRHDTGPMATDREINCPSAGKSVSAYRETDMSASTWHGREAWPCREAWHGREAGPCREAEPCQDGVGLTEPCATGHRRGRSRRPLLHITSHSTAVPVLLRPFRVPPTVTVMGL